jgi:hypothetical protein
LRLFATTATAMISVIIIIAALDVIVRFPHSLFLLILSYKRNVICGFGGMQLKIQTNLKERHLNCITAVSQI